MKHLQKFFPAGLAFLLAILPISAFASTGADFLGAISHPLSIWPNLFLLLGYGIWLYMQDSKCCMHHLVLYTMLGYVLGVFLGSLVPTVIFGVSIFALILIIMAIIIVAQLKLHHVGGIVLSLITGFFVASGLGGFSFTLVGIISLIGLLIGIFLGISSGYGLHCLLKDLYKGKIVMLVAIVIGLVGLLKLFAIM